MVARCSTRQPREAYSNLPCGKTDPLPSPGYASEQLGRWFSVEVERSSLSAIRFMKGRFDAEPLATGNHIESGQWVTIR